MLGIVKMSRRTKRSHHPDTAEVYTRRVRLHGREALLVNGNVARWPARVVVGYPHFPVTMRGACYRSRIDAVRMILRESEATPIVLAVENAHFCPADRRNYPSSNVGLIIEPCGSPGHSCSMD